MNKDNRKHAADLKMAVFILISAIFGACAYFDPFGVVSFLSSEEAMCLGKSPIPVESPMMHCAAWLGTATMAIIIFTIIAGISISSAAGLLGLNREEASELDDDKGGNNKAPECGKPLNKDHGDNYGGGRE